MTTEIRLRLPYPPSVNHYWAYKAVRRKLTPEQRAMNARGRGRGKRRMPEWVTLQYLTRAAKDFRMSVVEHMWEQIGPPPKLSERLAVEVHEYHGPKTEDGRIGGEAQDIDNCLKPLFDAMEKANIYINDSQIDQLLVLKKRRAAVGRVDVIIRTIGE